MEHAEANYERKAEEFYYEMRELFFAIKDPGTSFRDSSWGNAEYLERYRDSFMETMEHIKDSKQLPSRDFNLAQEILDKNLVLVERRVEMLNIRLEEMRRGGFVEIALEFKQRNHYQLEYMIEDIVARAESYGGVVMSSSIYIPMLSDETELFVRFYP